MCPICLSLVDHETEIWEILVARKEDDGHLPVSVIQDLKDLGLSPRQIGKHLKGSWGVHINPEAAVYCFFRNRHKAVSFLIALLPSYGITGCWELVEGLGINLKVTD